MRSGAPESLDSGPIFTLPAARTYTGLVRAIERAARDDEARGFFVRLGTENLDWSRSEELGRLFEELRQKTKKPVVCHAHELDNASAWLAARACDRIWLSPAGSVDSVGIAGQAVYVKNALEKLHIQADFLAMGRFKSASETFTRQGPSEAARENLFSVLSAMRQSWLESAARARSGKEVRHALEHGPWDAERAKAKGLVDSIGYESEAVEDLKKKTSAQNVVARFGPERDDGERSTLSQVIRLIGGVEGETDRPHLVVLPAEGSITMAGGGLLSEVGITARAFQKVLRRLAKDNSVRGVVIRVDSPGGSALASDLIWHEVMELRKKKPVVASVGDMAASGGYYIACAANRIVAENTSIVGSIGVVGGKIVVGEALEKLGVHGETVAASSEPGAAQRAAYLSPLVPWDEPTRARVREQMQSIYGLFVRRVAQGRGLSAEQVHKIAEGRIYSGAQAKAQALVDEIGGLRRALEVARKLASLDEGAAVRVEGVGETLLEALMLGEGATEQDVERALQRFQQRSRLLESLALPLRQFVSSLAPLVEGEAVVAALPYFFIIR